MIRLLIAGCFYLLVSCRPIGPSKIKLADQFQLNKDSPKEWNLSCKLGCNQYPSLNNVKHVRWNNHTIIVKNLSPVGYEKMMQWYIIHSEEQELKCCIYGTATGPIDSLAVESFILKNDIQELKILNL